MASLSLECDIVRRDQAAERHASHQSLIWKRFGVKEWSVLNLEPSKHLIFPPSVSWNLHKGISLREGYDYHFFFPPHFLPLRREIYKPQMEHREREGMTLKEVERRLGDTAVY